MVVVPDSEIRLLKTPFEMNDTNQLTFSSATAQYNYFNSLPKTIYDNLTYIRQNGVIRYEGNFDDLLGYNYCMYQNKAYSNKWFYAYITDIEYISDEVTYLTIETDVFQTWQFDLVYKNSFVEREHVNNDTIGLHTIPEGLETGEYIVNTYKQYESWNFADFVSVIGVTEIIETATRTYSSNGKVPQGLYYIAFDNKLDVRKYIQAYSDRGKLDAITTIFVMPREYFSNFSASSIDGVGNISTEYPTSYSSVISFERPSRISLNYIPKNNKLMTYPYRYMQISNNCGNANIYHYELFNIGTSNETIQFLIFGCITPNGSFRIIPRDYKNLKDNNDEGLNYGKMPVGSFTGDVYTNWLTANGVNIATNFIGNTISTIGAIGSIGTGEVIGGTFQLANSLNSIASSVGEIYQHSLIPDSINGNINNGDAIFNSSNNFIIFKHISIKDEYLRIIDNYFSMFGYKVNVVKTPNITGRLNWNYVKTIDINLIGNIPQKDLEKIRNIFNNGVTLWHNPNTFLDYSQNNRIV